jgi:hypothetical protein
MAFRASLWLIAAIFSVAVIQNLGRTPEARKKPGPSRGDVTLHREVLPEVLEGWELVKFSPAMDPDVVPQGIYWWVHQWVYRNGSQSVVVACDQLGESDWHELTYCYRNQNRIVVERTVQVDPADGSPFVTAQLKSEDGSLAALAFSVFYEDGEWTHPPAVNLDSLNQKPIQDTFAGRYHERLQQIVIPDSRNTQHDRAIQCQVLIECTEQTVQETMQAAMQLHLESRRRFRSEWLKHRAAGI